MELDHDRSMRTGALGKGLKKRLPPRIWSSLESTYAGAYISENWKGLFRLNARREVLIDKIKTILS